MMQRKEANSDWPARSFAHVYDALYGGDPEFLGTQLAFLREVFGQPPGKLLDIGCGTGNHLIPLADAGYSVTGIDLDRPMLQRARCKSSKPQLALADLRKPPFRRIFQGALCLESPLAYLLDDAELAAALRGIRNTLCAQGKLVIDVYDYPAVLGTRPVAPQEARFETHDMRVKVRESHRYEASSRAWSMRQQFEVEESRGTYAFEVIHRLRVRTVNEYAQALERVGFTVVNAMDGYPSTPQTLRHERRLILVARRQAAQAG